MGVEHSGVNFKFKMNEARAREPNKRTIIDEVQPVLPCSSAPRAAVIGVAKLADLNVTSSSFKTLEEVGYSTFSNKDPPGIESLSICDKLSNDQLQGERREEKKSNVIIVIILLVVLAVMNAALFACGFWSISALNKAAIKKNHVAHNLSELLKMEDDATKKQVQETLKKQVQATRMIKQRFEEMIFNKRVKKRAEEIMQKKRAEYCMKMLDHKSTRSKPRRDSIP